MSRPVSLGGARSLTSQAIALSAAMAIAQVAMAITYLLAARSTSPADFGLVVIALSLGTVAAGVIDFGSNSFIVREAVAGRMDLPQVRARILTKGLLGAVGLLGTAAIAAIFFQPSASLVVGGALVGFTALVGQSMLVPLRLHALGQRIAVCSLTERFLAVLIMLILVARVPDPSRWLPLVVAAGTAGAAVLAVLLTPREWRLYVTPEVREGLRNPWRGAHHYGVSSALTTVQGLDVSIAGAVGGSVVAGNYGAIARWTQPMGLLSTAYSQSAVPFVTAAESDVGALRYMRRSSWILAIAVVGCLTVAALSVPLVSVLLGSEYAASSGALAVLALGTIPAVLNQPLSMFLQSRGHDRRAALVIAIGVAVQLSLVAALGGPLGALGVAIAFSAAQVAILGMLLARAISMVRS